MLVRGEKNWDIIDDVYPIPGEFVIDKAGKGAFGQSNLPLILRNLGITHLIITGITTDVCVTHHNEGSQRQWLLVSTPKGWYRCHRLRQLSSRYKANKDARRRLWMGFGLGQICKGS